MLPQSGDDSSPSRWLCLIQEKGCGEMLDKMNLLGAVVAHVIFLSSILTFVARLLGKVQLGQQVGYILLLMTFPLVYLLVKALNTKVWGKKYTMNMMKLKQYLK